MTDRIVLDTNIFVAAAFNRHSSSASIVQRVRDGAVTLVWNEITRTETRFIVERIPRIRWSAIEDLFDPAHQVEDSSDTWPFQMIEDPDDRKFAALAAAADAVLVTNDAHLLAAQGRINVAIQTPAAYLRSITSNGS